MKKIGIYIFLLVTCYSCSKDTSTADIYNIPVEFELNLSQALTDEGPVPAFEIKTINEVGCEESELNVIYSRYEDKLKFHIMGVNDMKCDTQEDVIEYKVHDQLQIKDFDLLIKLKDYIENTGTLAITSNYYHSDLKDLKGVINPVNHIMRIPENIVWGRIEVENERETSPLENFFTIMGSDLHPYDNILSGNYSLFSVDKNKNVIIDGKTSSSISINFLMSPQVSKERIMEKIELFMVNNVKVKLNVWSSTGLMI